MSNKKSWCPFLQRDCEEKCVNHYLIPNCARIISTEGVAYLGKGHCSFFNIDTNNSGMLNMRIHEEKNDKGMVGKIRKLTHEEEIEFGIVTMKRK
jgi:hypothetical protein